MNQITCTRRIQFCAGHRVPRHESKCRNLHGHNYVAFFTASAPKLDDRGRVIDFGVLKERIGGWIDKNWDHGMVLQHTDPMRPIYEDEFKGHKLFTMGEPPTAECMADYLLREVCPLTLSGTGVTVTKVVLWETENCYAEAVL